MNNYYVYTHNKLSDGSCFYIGIGKNARVYDGGAKRNKVIQGGTSAGKTFGILPILIDRVNQNPNA